MIVSYGLYLSYSATINTMTYFNLLSDSVKFIFLFINVIILLG